MPTGKFFWSVDPGHTNLIAGSLYYLDSEYKLFHTGIDIQNKKADYYQQAGFNDHKAKEDLWMRPFAGDFEELSRSSTKTTDRIQFHRHLTIYNRMYAALWDEVSLKRHRRMNLHCHFGRQAYIARMVRQFFHPFLDELPLVVMGSAKISPTIRGTTSAPTIAIQDAIKATCEAYYQGESRTSILCADCGALTKYVCLHGADGYRNVVRGLEHCGSKLCRECMIQLKNRDGNGSQGIAIRFIFNPDAYNTAADGRNLTSLRTPHFINHGNKETEKENRELGRVTRSLRKDYNESTGKFMDNNENMEEDSSEDEDEVLEDSSEDEVEEHSRATESHLPRRQQQPPQPSIDQQVSSAIETYRNRDSLADLSDDRRMAKPLVNPHNDCYVNSFLQLFFHIEAIRTLFLNKTFMNHLNDQVMCNGTSQQIKESGAVVALALGHQFRQMFDGKDGLSGTYFKDSLRTITDKYNNNHQQDVNELLNQVLDILHVALGSNGGHDSPISELFGLRKCGICECQCGYDSQNNADRGMILNLPITTESENENTSLIELLTKEYKERESIVWTCGNDNCNRTNGEHYNRLSMISSFVIVALGRFSTNDNLPLHHPDRLTKKNTLVDFPLQDLNLSPYTNSSNEGDEQLYDLVGILNHKGTFNTGHYFSYVLINGVWREFNDYSYPLHQTSKVISSDCIVTSKAYTLLYCEKSKMEEMMGEKVSTTSTVSFDDSDSSQHRGSNEISSERQNSAMPTTQESKTQHTNGRKKKRNPSSSKKGVAKKTKLYPLFESGNSSSCLKHQSSPTAKNSGSCTRARLEQTRNQTATQAQKKKPPKMMPRHRDSLLQAIKETYHDDKWTVNGGWENVARLVSHKLRSDWNAKKCKKKFNELSINWPIYVEYIDSDKMGEEE